MQWLAREKKLLQQAQELKQLRRQVEQLKQQNESMRTGMRRCISCEYRVGSSR